VEEIGKVAAHLGKLPVLVAHSMGGLASQKYAESNEVAAMVLITPGVPNEVSQSQVDLPLDMDQPWGPPPFEMAKEMFFQNSSEEDARKFYSLLCAESPQAVYEVTRGWLLHIDKVRLSHPILVIGAELDHLAPPQIVRNLADYYSADYLFIFGKGHNLLLEPDWETTTGKIRNWLEKNGP
jgi:pimeloyl-ACP methyl ester carboxylesterase